MSLILDEKTGVYHYTTNRGFHLALVSEGAMDAMSELKNKEINDLKLKLEAVEKELTRTKEDLESFGKRIYKSAKELISTKEENELQKKFIKMSLKLYVGLQNTSEFLDIIHKESEG